MKENLYQLLLVLFVGNALAQGTALPQHLTVHLESKLEGYYALVAEGLWPQALGIDLNNIFRPSYDDSLATLAVQQEGFARLQSIRNAKGVSWHSSYARNVFGALFEDDGIFYQWRASTGVDWHLIKGGWLASRQKYAQQSLQWELEVERERQRQRLMGYRLAAESIECLFSQERILLLEHRQDILSQLREVIDELHELRYVQQEEVVEVVTKAIETNLILESNRQRAQYLLFLPEFADLKAPDLPIFDFRQLDEGAIAPDTSLIFAGYQKGVQALQHEFHWSDQVSLNASGRYQYFWGGPAASYAGRDFTTLGLTLSVPLPFGSSNRATRADARKLGLLLEYRRSRDERYKDLQRHHVSFQSTMRRFTTKSLDREKICLGIERARRQKRMNDPGYSAVALLSLYDDLLSVELDLTDLKEMLYLKAIELLACLPPEDVYQYVEEVAEEPWAQQDNAVDKVLFCSHDELSTLDPTFVIEFLKHYGYGQLVVDGGPIRKLTSIMPAYSIWHEILTSSSGLACRPIGIWRGIG